MSNGARRGLRNLPNSKGETLTDLLARRPELRDVGIAGYLVGAAVDGAPGMPPMRGTFMLDTPNGVVFTWVAAA